MTGATAFSVDGVIDTVYEPRNLTADIHPAAVRTCGMMNTLEWTRFGVTALLAMSFFCVPLLPDLVNVCGNQKFDTFV
jgi:hypothetical protein